MRKIALLVLVSVGTLLPTVATAAEGERRAGGFGIGIGSATIANGVSAKYFLGGAALQGVVGFWGGGGIGERFGHIDGLAVGFDYLLEMPSLARSPYFSVDWSFGLGAGFGVQTFAHQTPAVAGSGIAGLEFNFTRVPLDLVVEFRPTLAILPDPKLHLVDFTAHLRVYF
jgi:hypothetical protein